jgi:hypothetical protein
MAEKWYFAREGRSFGPFSAAQLKESAATEELRPQDTVWKEGMERGVLAAKVRHLFPPIQAPPTPPSGRTVPALSPSLSPLPGSPSSPPILGTHSELPAGLPEEDVPFLESSVGIPDDLELVPIEDGIPAYAPEPAPASTKRRVLGVKGAVLVGQNGVVVCYRNKCRRCGRADIYVTTMRIRPGTTCVNYFCPKCRKTQQVEVLAGD